MKKLLATAFALAILLPMVASAQLLIKCTQEPEQAITQVVSEERGLNRFQCTVFNLAQSGTAPRTIHAFSDIDVQIPNVPFIGPSEVAMLFTGAIQKSALSKAIKYGGVALTLAAIPLPFIKSIGTTTALKWSFGLSEVGLLGPPVISTLQSQQPNVSPLFNQAQYPQTLAPGTSYVDYPFAVRPGGKKHKGTATQPTTSTYNIP